MTMLANIDLAVEGLGEAGDPLIWWPGAIEDLVRQVDGEVDQLARAVSNERHRTGAAIIGNLTLDEFKAFYNEWKRYKDGLGWWGKMTGATVDRTRNYRKRAMDWRDKFVGLGVSTLVAPAPPAPKSGFPWVKTAFVLGGIAVGAYAVSKLTDLGKLLPARRNPRRRRRRR
jgi:hypothetical protein